MEMNEREQFEAIPHRMEIMLVFGDYLETHGVAAVEKFSDLYPPMRNTFEKRARLEGCKSDENGKAKNTKTN